MIIKKGYKKTDIGEIPVDWEVRTLGEIGECIIGLTYKPENISSDGILVLRSSNIQNNTLAYDNNVFVDLEVNEKLINKENDILICVRNGSKKLIGKCALIKGDAIGETFGAFMSMFRSPYNEYLINVFQSDIMKKQIEEHLGATINQITNKSLNSFQIPLPPLPEQKAIAKVLSDMDNLITALEAEIEKMRLVKQGAMQELLSAGDDWEVRSLGEIANITMGQSPSSSSYNQSKIGLPLVQGNADIKNRKTIIRNYTSEITKTCEVNDIIMSVRAPVGEIAKATFDACLGRGVCAITYENDFIYHYLIFIEPTWSKLSTGSTFDSVNSTVIRNLEIPLPPLSEQTKITTILTDIDLTIGSKEAELEKYRAMKVGLMQELLSGKRRLVRG